MTAVFEVAESTLPPGNVVPFFPRGSRVIRATEHITFVECRLPAGVPSRTVHYGGQYVLYSDPGQLPPHAEALNARA